MGRCYQKTPPLKFVNFLSPSIMATPKFVFIMSFIGWMRKNKIKDIDVESFNSKIRKGEKTRLIRGVEETVFLSTRLGLVEELVPAELQIVEINDANLCLCKKHTGEIVGRISINDED